MGFLSFLFGFGSDECEEYEQGYDDGYSLKDYRRKKKSKEYLDGYSDGMLDELDEEEEDW